MQCILHYNCKIYSRLFLLLLIISSSAKVCSCSGEGIQLTCGSLEKWMLGVLVLSEWAIIMKLNLNLLDMKEK